MPFPNLGRWGGVAAMLGGMMLMVVWGHAAFTVNHTELTRSLVARGYILRHDYSDYYRLLVAPLPLLMIGLVGVYSRRFERSRKLERTGFVIAMTGFVILMAGAFLFWFFDRNSSIPLTTNLWELMSSPKWMANMARFFGLVVLGFGLVLFGIAAFRAKALSHWKALPLIIGLLAPLSYVGLEFYPYEMYAPLPWVLFGLGWLLLGYVFWQDRSDVLIRAQSATAQPAPRSSQS